MLNKITKRIGVMRGVFLLLAILLPSVSGAQIFQCIKNGKTSFQEEPCDPSSNVSRDITANLGIKSNSSWDGLKDGRSVCRPEFQTVSGPMNAGTAFILDVPVKSAKALLVTAHHLFGPNGGMEKQVTWQELPEKVTKAKCTFLSSRGGSMTVGKPLPIKNARAIGEGGNARDIAAFPITETPAYAIKLAVLPPKVGDEVWLVAKVVSGAPSTEILHKARVTRSDRSVLEFEYENRAINIRATSGAPIVNKDGKLVGVNVGASHGSGDMVGSAVGLGEIADGLAGIQ
jgi:hypothetical protein